MLLCVVTVLAAAAAAPAQATRLPTADEILVLHQTGLPETDLGTVLDKNGVPALSAGDLARLAEAGVPDSVMERLRVAAARAAPRKVTVEEIIKMVDSAVPEDAVLEMIRSSEDGFAVTADQWLELVRKGVPPTVLKALRARPVVKGAESKPARVTIDDLPRLSQEGVTSGEIVQRIRATDCSFEISVDQIIQLSRQGVSKEVLKEVWARRAPSERPVAAEGAPAPTSESRPEEPPVPAMSLHVESAGNFSLLVPAEFRTHRESRGANALVSFLLGDNDKGTGLAEAELSVFRYRSSTPDRLNEANLPAIANNFLGSLQASYAKRQLTVAFGDRRPVKAAGQPALEARVVTSGSDGVTHQGEILITWADDQIFVVSTAVRTDRLERQGSALKKCLKSFALLTRKARPTAGSSDDEKLVALAHAWRDAVLSRDWSLYDSLFQTPGVQERRREKFIAVCDRFSLPGKRLVLGPTTSNPDGGKVQYRIIPSDPPETFDVAWIRDGQSFALDE
jgi:hypothetical protein